MSNEYCVWIFFRKSLYIKKSKSCPPQELLPLGSHTTFNSENIFFIQATSIVPPPKSKTKMLLLSSLIAAIVIPQGIGTGLSICAYLGLMFLISVIIGTIESATARIRMSHVFEFIFIMSSFALIVLSLVAARMFGG